MTLFFRAALDGKGKKIKGDREVLKWSGREREEKGTEWWSFRGNGTEQGGGTQWNMKEGQRRRDK